jgi:hypothetical protein
MLNLVDLILFGRRRSAVLKPELKEPGIRYLAILAKNAFQVKPVNDTGGIALHRLHG